MSFAFSLIGDVVSRLRTVRNVEAIVLGGSYATGSQRPDSDIDLGIYYHHANLDVSEIRQIAMELSDFPNPAVTDLGGWGRWVNGGAWLTVQGQRVDLLYRDIDFVSQIIDDCLQGRWQLDYNQQPAYGFYSYMYCAETQVCKALHDPDQIIVALKSKVAVYPQPLKQTIVQSDMWGAEFTLRNCTKSAERGQVFIVAGCLTRIASYLVQTLYALNETYFLSEKRFREDEQAFAIKPRDFTLRLEQILSSIGSTKNDLLLAVSEMTTLFEELKTLCGALYKARFE